MKQESLSKKDEDYYHLFYFLPIFYNFTQNNDYHCTRKVLRAKNGIILQFNETILKRNEKQIRILLVSLFCQKSRKKLKNYRILSI